MTGPPADSGRPESARDHALRLVEFPRVLELVAELATSGLGRELVRALRPLIDPAAAAEALATTDDMITFLLRTPEWAPPEILDARAALDRLAIEGSVLDETALGEMRVLLSASRNVRQDVRRRSDDFRRITTLADRMLESPEVETRLERSIDPAGEVADAASPSLSRLRRQMRSERSSLVSRLERFTSELPERFRVPDGSVTVRSGRYCVPVRREGRSHVGGIVHDESASSRTLFVEPALAIEPMNRIRELELAERREILRILAELTEQLRPLVSELRGSLEALSELDALFARGRYALSHGGVRPELGSGGERAAYRVREAYHPVLRAVGERAVPFDLELATAETVLLVSGPNAGGKTVLLKTIGLLSAMAQSGVVPPVGEGTCLPVFSSFFAIIGDEQSIDASLSTFGAQIGNLREILEESDGGSLVMIDEIGSNTDPAEGSALAAAALLHLADRAALTAVSTHLGDLKTLAGEDLRIVNASLQFDPATLRPTYRLIRDRPGRSYALEISQRLGLPSPVLDAARQRLSEGARALETVLAELEEREEEVERLRGSLETERRAAGREKRALAERGAEADRREAELEEREHALERDAGKRAERYLLESRREVERIIDQLKARWAEAMRSRSGDSAAGSRTEPERAATEARRAVERSLEQLRVGIPDAPGAGRPRDRPTTELRVGDSVRLASGSGVGRLVELGQDRAVVEVGGVRITVDPDALRADAGSTRRPARTGAVRAPVLEASRELNLRGLRVEEVEAALIPALDAAIHADLPSLLIIHGKGTGALRERVQELLAADERVPSFRPGTQPEGGGGVTVVELSS